MFLLKTIAVATGFFILFPLQIICKVRIRRNDGASEVNLRVHQDSLGLAKIYYFLEDRNYCIRIKGAILVVILLEII